MPASAWATVKASRTATLRYLRLVPDGADLYVSARVRAGVYLLTVAWDAGPASRGSWSARMPLGLEAPANAAVTAAAAK